MKADELAQLVVEALDDSKAVDVRVVDVRGKSNITDIMVVATGTSSRHVKSLADNVVVEVKKQGVRPLGVEGEDIGEWVLVDLGDVVVHVLQAEMREFYQLEKLWETEPANRSKSSGAQ
ncbi:MAG: ribosome silencing factor [Gammaproteobacteria bacterium]|nr:ribosome silencing factor [Gammaproteobacteria bacterium]